MTSHSSSLGDNDIDEDDLIAEQLAAYKASRDIALQKAELHPVLKAARDGNIEKVQSLLEEDKGSLGVTDLVGRNILQHAARSGKRELVAILASAPYTIPLDNTDSVGQQAIHQAAKGGHNDLAIWLVEVGEIPLSTVDNRGRNVFHEAALNGQLEFMQWASDCLAEKEGLLNMERLVGSHDKDHNTALHFAAQRGHVGVLKWIIKQGVTVVDKNLYKKTALDIAIHHNHKEAVMLLKDLTSTELKLRQAQKDIRHMQERSRAKARQNEKNVQRLKENHNRTKQQMAKLENDYANLQAEAETKDQTIASLEMEVQTLNASIEQIIAAHKAELWELTQNL